MLAFARSQLITLVKILFWYVPGVIVCVIDAAITKLRRLVASPSTQGATADLDRIAVCVITYNCKEAVRNCLDAVFAEEAGVPPSERRIQVFVADGGSTDETLDAVMSFPVTGVCRAASGRANCQNAAVQLSSQVDVPAPVVLLLHGDTVLPKGWAAAVRKTLSHKGVSLGGFGVDFNLSPFRGLERAVMQFVAWQAGIRSTLLETMWGDNSMFCTRQHFKRLDGFRPLPLMEDWDFSRRSMALGTVEYSQLTNKTRAARWSEERPRGLAMFDNTCLNHKFFGMWLTGLWNEEQIHEKYYPGRPIPTSYPFGSPELILEVLRLDD